MFSTRRNKSRRSFLRGASRLRLERLEDRMVMSGASPAAVNDLYETIVDQPLEVSAPAILANDTDAEGDALAASLFKGPDHGTLELAEDGSFNYLPEAGFLGFDSFIYVANDGTSDSMLGAVTIEVLPGNHEPVAANDSYDVDEDGLLTIDALEGFLANDTDEDGDPLSPTVVSQPLNGSLETEDDGSFVYTPAANFNGLDGFSYFVSDGSAESDVASVTLVVNSVNDTPVSVNDEYATPEDMPLTIEAPGVLINDSDIDGDALAALLVNPPIHGSVTLSPDGALVYTPDANFNGIDGFSYLAGDGTADSEAAAVTITVCAVNDAPAAAADAYTMDEDSTLAVDIAGGVLTNDTDVEGDPLSASIVSGPENGTLSLNPDGSFSYVPTINFTGADSFVYAASDGDQSGEAIVTITVNEIADAPIAAIDNYSTGEDVPMAVGSDLGVLANDIDPQGNPLVAEVVTGPEHGTLSLNADGSFDYAPAANYHGADSFTYKAKNATEEMISMANIVVEPLNDRPAAADDEFTIEVGGGSVTVTPAANVMANDTDIDGEGATPMVANLVSGPEHGTLALNPDGTFNYVPEEGYEGEDAFRYQLFDGMANSNVATVTLHVQETPEPEPVPPPVPAPEPTPNQRPEAVNESFTVEAGTTLDVAAIDGILANDFDPEGGALSAEWFSGPLHGALSVADDGSFTYTPEDGFEGLDAFLYRASDGELWSALAAVTIHVTPRSEPAPVPVPQPEPEPNPCPPQPCDLSKREFCARPSRAMRLADIAGDRDEIFREIGRSMGRG
jgi:hypothetical protein